MATDNNILEICANSLESALIAQKSGAKRIEFCDNLAEGGTTPSYGQIALAKEMLKIELWPIIRPRGGDFLYSDVEFQIMKKDIEMCKSLNCNGAVLGILKADGTIDLDRNRELIALASPMPLAFHRAFDRCYNLQQSLEELIDLGFVRVLTSGAKKNAIEGISNLAKLVEQAHGRISVMPGAGINSSNLKKLMNITGAKEFHTTAKSKVASKMVYQDNLTEFGQNDNDYEQSSAREIEALVAILNSN